MNEQTPLEEVAQHLPVEAATLLLAHEPPVQRMVLTQVRSMVTFWEGCSLNLDPLSYHIVLASVVAMVTPLVHLLHTENASDLERT